MEYNTAIKISRLERYSATWTNARNDLSKKQVTEWYTGRNRLKMCKIMLRVVYEWLYVYKL